MDTEIINPPVVDAGAGIEPPSWETPPKAQASEEPQKEVSTPNQVEVKDNVPQVTVPQRIKPSDYYRERERIRRLEETNSGLSKKMDEMTNLIREMRNPKPDGTVIAKLTAEELLQDPEKVFNAREQRLLNEFQTLRQEISDLRNEKVNSERNQQEREALEMLFPKASPDSNESLEDRIENSERKEFLDNFFKQNPALDRMMRIDPKSAAELALLKLSQTKPQVTPKVIPKSLMGNTARGNPSGGGKQKTSVEDLMSDLKKLSKEASDIPSLRHDVEHRKRREALMKEIETLAQEQGNNK